MSLKHMRSHIECELNWFMYVVDYRIKAQNQILDNRSRFNFAMLQRRTFSCWFYNVIAR